MLRSPVSTIPLLLVATAQAAQPAGLERRAPFTALRFQGEQVLVEVDGNWYRWLSIDDIAVDTLLATAKQPDRGAWQRRLGEDLVWMLAALDHEAQFLRATRRPKAEEAPGVHDERRQRHPPPHVVREVPEITAGPHAKSLRPDSRTRQSIGEGLQATRRDRFWEGLAAAAAVASLPAPAAKPCECLRGVPAGRPPGAPCRSVCLPLGWSLAYRAGCSRNFRKGFTRFTVAYTLDLRPPLHTVPQNRSTHCGSGLHGARDSDYVASRSTAWRGQTAPPARRIRLLDDGCPVTYPSRPCRGQGRFCPTPAASGHLGHAGTGRQWARLFAAGRSSHCLDKPARRDRDPTS